MTVGILRSKSSAHQLREGAVRGALSLCTVRSTTSYAYNILYSESIWYADVADLQVPGTVCSTRTSSTRTWYIPGTVFDRETFSLLLLEYYQVPVVV